MAAADPSVPTLTVFDLDACLWDKEMFEMPAVPEDPADAVKGDLNGRGEGTVGVRSGPHRISLHRGALQALQEHADGKHPGMRIACASSADTPFAEQIGRKTLTMLEVLPGVTVWDLLMRDWDGRDVNQIGRQPPLSSNKAETHFPRLREATGVPFDEMLFFDDCNWVRRRRPRPRAAAPSNRPRRCSWREPGARTAELQPSRRVLVACVRRATTAPWSRVAARSRAGSASCACARLSD